MELSLLIYFNPLQNMWIEMNICACKQDLRMCIRFRVPYTCILRIFFCGALTFTWSLKKSINSSFLSSLSAATCHHRIILRLEFTEQYTKTIKWVHTSSCFLSNLRVPSEISPQKKADSSRIFLYFSSFISIRALTLLCRRGHSIVIAACITMSQSQRML